MAEFGFKIGVGWDVESPPNVEDIITDAPTVLDDQFIGLHGPVRHVAIDGTIHRSGKRSVVWTWDTMTQADFNTLIDAIWGTKSSQQVTIWTIDERGEYTGYNAHAERPQPGEHYRHAFGGAIVDLRIYFIVIAILPFSYDLSFDDSFG